MTPRPLDPPSPRGVPFHAPARPGPRRLGQALSPAARRAPGGKMDGESLRASVQSGYFEGETSMQPLTIFLEP